MLQELSACYSNQYLANNSYRYSSYGNVEQAIHQAKWDWEALNGSGTPSDNAFSQLEPILVYKFAIEDLKHEFHSTGTLQIMTQFLSAFLKDFPMYQVISLVQTKNSTEGFIVVLNRQIESSPSLPQYDIFKIRQELKEEIKTQILSEIRADLFEDRATSMQIEDQDV